MKTTHRLLCLILIAGALHGPAPAVHARGTSCEIATRSEQIGGGTIVYNIVGTGPTLLLVHGLFGDKEQWSGLACLLAGSGFAALAVDLPGYA